MAKIRAYKLAEELGIDRTDILEKARAIGIELKSAMASLEEADAEKLRKKLGVSVPRMDVTEERVEGGGVVIRRRRKKKVELEPRPEVEVAPEDVTPEAVAPKPAEVEPDGPVIEEGPTEPPVVDVPVRPAAATHPAAPA